MSVEQRNFPKNEAAVAAAAKAFGPDRGLPVPLEDIHQARTILLVGGNLAGIAPRVVEHFAAQAKGGGSLIVADPLATTLAKAATLHLQLTPGTEVALANGLLYIAIKEGYIDEAFISERTSGFGRVRVTVASYWPDRVEHTTGISERQLALAARLLGEASRAMILTAYTPEPQSIGVTNALAFINLALALGKCGRLHSGYGYLPEPHGLVLFGASSMKAGDSARFHPVEFSGAVEQPDQDYPLYLTTDQSIPVHHVQIHPSMAQTYGIAEGDPVDLTTRRGRVRMSAQLTSAIRMDTVFVPFHLAGEGRAELFSHPALEYKVCTVRIEKGLLC